MKGDFPQVVAPAWYRREQIRVGRRRFDTAEGAMVKKLAHSDLLPVSSRIATIAPRLRLKVAQLEEHFLCVAMKSKLLRS